MKANELMIGDWVFYDEKCYQVDGFFRITNTLCLRYNGYDAHYEDSTKVAEDTKPIPLTAEILEKNGFEMIRNGQFPSIEVNGYITFQLESYDGEGYVGFHNPYCKLRYVHELQHALRLCGLNELADNFKV